MSTRTLMVSRMRAESAEEVARLFAEHDSTGVAARLGVTSRTLLHYEGLTMHLIQSEAEVLDRFGELRADPSFQKLNQALSAHMRPLVDDWHGVRDSRAHEFYHRSWV
ncbi:TcmI family type II polyketide cyclase [Nocardiopsis halophila]|uniref:TcmI family type II polyketide cyclase n=1 Tax=Nocardiopsis halophila TaxID=141692 RepID=UPI0004763601|nr:TcmI family type II polyketide cyclase [Nocardiopsis halophila]